MRKIKLALVGFGNAGQAFAKMLLDKMVKIEDIYECRPIVTAISTATKGNLLVESGINLEEALSDVENKGRFLNKSELTDMSTMDIVKNADYDVLIEMTPLNIMTGQPAINHIEEALKRKKHIITANKGPVAWAYSRLRKAADEAGVGFFHETTVMDGTPVFNLADFTLRMAEVKEISGILNSTTNYILEEMAKGTKHEEIMKRGREMGFVEADPAMDIEGYDAAAKITVLMNVLMNADMTPDQVERKGIEKITVEDIKDAAARGKVIKLMCRGSKREDGSIYASVQPEEIDKNDMLASVNSTTSVVSVTTDLMKKITVVEHEPEIEQTAYGIFGDLLRVLDIMCNVGLS